MLLALHSAGGAPAAELDRRELVVLPEMMQQHMLANMRDHLSAIAEIQDALADGRFDVAKNVAAKAFSARDRSRSTDASSAISANWLAALCICEPIARIGSGM